MAIKEGYSLLHEYLQYQEISLDCKEAFAKREVALIRAVENHFLETIVWECTRRCDIKCLHCGTPAEQADSLNELSTTQAKIVFDNLEQAFDLSSLTCVSITGGEPTVRSDLVEMVEYIKSFGVPQIVTHTNGHRLALEPKLPERLVKAGVTGIGVNLDGMEKNHNWLRRNPNAFNYSVNALRLTKDSGADTMVSTVLTKRVIKDLPHLRDKLVDLQPDRWRLIPIEPIGRAPLGLVDELLHPEDITTVLSFVLECQAINLPFGVEMGCGQWYGKKLEALVRPYIWYCIAGVNVLGILSDGSIGACNNIDRSYCQGNALRDDIGEVWRSGFRVFRDRDWCKKGECINCIDWALCRGGEMHLRDSTGERLAPCFYHWLEKKYQCAI